MKNSRNNNNKDKNNNISLNTYKIYFLISIFTGIVTNIEDITEYGISGFIIGSIIGIISISFSVNVVLSRLIIKFLNIVKLNKNNNLDNLIVVISSIALFLFIFYKI